MATTGMKAVANGKSQNTALRAVHGKEIACLLHLYHSGWFC